MSIGSLFRVWAWPLLVAWVVLSGAQLRSESQGRGAGFAEHLFTVQTDLYLFYYVVLPLWLILMGIGLSSRGGESRWIRDGSHLRGAFRQWRWCLGQAAWVSAAVIAGSAASAVGLPFRNDWAGGANEAVAMVQAMEVSPWAAVVLQALLPLPAMAAVGLAVFLLHEWRPNPALTVGLIAACFLGLLMTGRRELLVSTSGLFLLGQYAGLGRALAAPLGGLAAAIGLVVIAAAWDKRLLDGRSSVPGWVWVILGGIAILTGHSMQLKAFGPFGLADLAHRSLSGGTSERLDVFSFITYLLLLAMPALLLAGAAAERAVSRMPLLLIRHGSLPRVLLGGLVPLALWSVAIATLLVGVLASLAGTIGGGVVAGDLPLGATLWLATAVQTFVLMALFFGVGVAVHDPRWLAGVFGITLVASMPWLNPGWLPFGLSLTGGVDGQRLLDAIPPLIGAAILLVVLFVLLSTLGRRILERN